MEIEGYVLVYEFSNEYHPVKTDGKIVFKSEPNALEEIAQTFFRENPRISELEARFARLDSVYINHREKSGRGEYALDGRIACCYSRP